MSSGVDRTDAIASLRAMAHPLRLRILSLLTGASLSAAEVAREFDITHANASYHLRQLHASGLLDIVEVEAIRGGRAKRYRHDPAYGERARPDADVQRLVYQAMADELLRRSARQERVPGMQLQADAELWVDDDVWAEVVARVRDAILELHQRARPPRTSGTRPVNATVAMFTMRAGS